MKSLRWTPFCLAVAGSLTLGACAEDSETDLMEGEPIEETVPSEQAPSEPVATESGIAVSEIIASPATWTGRTVSGEVRVTEVPTDRGFWIEDEGQRLFVVIIDVPEEEPKDIQAGTTINLEEAMVRDPSALQNIPGAPLDADTESIARDQEAFLLVDEANIDMMPMEGGS